MGYEGIEKKHKKTIINFISYILDLEMNKPKVNITDIRICFEFVRLLDWHAVLPRRSSNGKVLEEFWTKFSGLRDFRFLARFYNKMIFKLPLLISLYIIAGARLTKAYDVTIHRYRKSHARIEEYNAYFAVYVFAVYLRCMYSMCCAVLCFASAIGAVMGPMPSW